MALSLRKRRYPYGGVACPRCRLVLRHAALQPGHQDCTRCGGDFQVVRFDPPPVAVAVAPLAGADGATPCARHARNQAVAACQRCGQFMCGLCRIDADGQAYCPGCFERLSAEGALASTATRFRNYTGLSTACLLGSILFLFAAVPLCAAGIYFSIRGYTDARKRGETGGAAGMVFRIIGCVLLGGLGILMYAAIFGALG